MFQAMVPTHSHRKTWTVSLGTPRTLIQTLNRAR